MMVNKRADLIQRATVIINKRYLAQRMYERQDATIDLSAALIRADLEANRNRIDRLESLILQDHTALDELRAEFLATLTACRLYFGPETNEAIKKIGGDGKQWWEYEEADYQRLMTALGKELGYALKY